MSAMPEVIDSLRNCLAFTSRDMSLDKRDAWVYGVIVGWGDALPDVAERHTWDAETIARLERLRVAFNAV